MWVYVGVGVCVCVRWYQYLCTGNYLYVNFFICCHSNNTFIYIQVYVSPPNPDPWDPEVLRSHLEHLRRERFHHHHHHHHHHHNHHHRTSKFPTAPTSDFLWPLPKEEEEEKEDGWRVCKTM